MLKQALLLSSLAGLTLLVASPAAHADPVTYTLSQTTLTCKQCGPTFGTVVVDENSNQTSATVTVNLSDSDRQIFFEDGKDTGDGDALEFNLGGSPGSFAISGLTSGFEIDPGAPPDTTGFGSFVDGVICSYKNSSTDKGACQANSDTATSLSFTITSTDGSHILFTPTNGIFFSSSVTDKAIPDPSGDVGAPSPTPEPSSLALLGTSVLAVAGALRRRFRA